MIHFAFTERFVTRRQRRAHRLGTMPIFGEISARGTGIQSKRRPWSHGDDLIFADRGDWRGAPAFRLAGNHALRPHPAACCGESSPPRPAAGGAPMAAGSCAMRTLFTIDAGTLRAHARRSASAPTSPPMSSPLARVVPDEQDFFRLPPLDR